MNLEEAKQTIEAEKQKRINDFVKDLKNLQELYNCQLSVVYDQVSKEKPSEAQIIVIAL